MRNKKPTDFGACENLAFGFKPKEVSEEQIAESWKRILDNIRRAELVPKTKAKKSG